MDMSAANSIIFADWIFKRLLRMDDVMVQLEELSQAGCVWPWQIRQSRWLLAISTLWDSVGGSSPGDAGVHMLLEKRHVDSQRCNSFNRTLVSVRS